MFYLRIDIGHCEAKWNLKIVDLAIPGNVSGPIPSHKPKHTCMRSICLSVAIRRSLQVLGPTMLVCTCGDLEFAWRDVAWVCGIVAWVRGNIAWLYRDKEWVCKDFVWVV